MIPEKILVVGSITVDHIKIKRNNSLNYFCSIGGGSAANIYFALKSFGTPVNIMGVIGCRDRKVLKVAIKDLHSITDEKSFIYLHYKTYVKEYHHILKKRKDNKWICKLIPYSPLIDEKRTKISQFRKIFFKYFFEDIIKDCSIFYTDRISRSGLFFARVIGKYCLKIFNMGNVSWRYKLGHFRLNLIIEAIKFADIIQIPIKVYKEIKNYFKFKNIQEINPNILIWVIISKKDKIIAYHVNIGEVELPIQEIQNLIDWNGVEDAFMSMLIFQLHNLLGNSLPNMLIKNMSKNQFVNILKNCLENAKKACLFIGARTYVYYYLQNKDNFLLEEYLFNSLEDKNYYRDSIQLLRSYGEQIFYRKL